MSSDRPGRWLMSEAYFKCCHDVIHLRWHYKVATLRTQLYNNIHRNPNIDTLVRVDIHWHSVYLLWHFSTFQCKCMIQRERLPAQISHQNKKYVYNLFFLHSSYFVCNIYWTKSCYLHFLLFCVFYVGCVIYRRVRAISHTTIILHSSI